MKGQNVKLGISTWIWTSPFNTDTIKLFPKIKAMGYDSVEIPVEYPELIDGQEVSKALEDCGLTAVVCGAFGPERDFTHEDVAVHQNCMDYILACFDLCEMWDCGFLAGPMYSAVGKVRMLTPEQRKEDWKLAVENLQKVCEVAGPRNLSLAIEPLNRFESDMVNTADDVMRLIHDIGHTSAKVMLDSFHMNLEENDIGLALKKVGDDLLHFQVSDSHRGVPGTGLSPWDEIKKGLQVIQYDDVVSIESFTPEVKELAGAVCIWRTFASSQDEFARLGISFLKQLLHT
ncbi:sugar phosphate isomerase/epimerase family protein [Membranihabitans marinus]|uniref:sugar phosphate isomerase/epimerase family protein n=1 Tax=Membranihabitans marinus TaxID=1227546 RepID=UPI001F3987D2|nr:sugar phosphate isomerase/epimerase [Membranihabitans marinus]